MITSFEPVKPMVATFGRWDLCVPERQIYRGPQSGSDRPFGICVSNVTFVEGEARVTVKMSKITPDAAGRFLIGYKDLFADYLMVGVGGHGYAYTLYEYKSGVGWPPIVQCGTTDNLVAEKPIKISVQVKGQRLAFKVDDVRVFEHLLKSPIPLGQLGLLAWDVPEVEFTDFRVKEDRGSAFVVMQFTERYLELYNEVIKPVASSDSFKLKVHHSGEILGRVILQDITRGLEESRVVIAEITPANKNVFYELGYAHALKKAAILLVEKGSVNKLPFDIKGYRCIVYENTIVGKRHVQTELERHLEAILSG